MVGLSVVGKGLEMHLMANVPMGVNPHATPRERRSHADPCETSKVNKALYKRLWTKNQEVIIVYIATSNSREYDTEQNAYLAAQGGRTKRDTKHYSRREATAIKSFTKVQKDSGERGLPG
ncbi:hypothetical protein FOZ63_032136 [Perkinsus olseni]|uniref:Uncharacterized protein n=1 Tax=Perkinsus olseni TaxID=32597 RepID=A0A7J6NSZ4_PEROL|nr:hypothetical protein FOZ60_004975 [Perkinsus olseni]KAF4715209.1 hypothetical protein FOZ62_032299 [Perkinsus olseni]KAF4748738.1 hypothetical protein FOZ63_032136 [Perkinsus olseni]